MFIFETRKPLKYQKILQEKHINFVIFHFIVDFLLTKLKTVGFFMIKTFTFNEQLTVLQQF